MLPPDPSYLLHTLAVGVVVHDEDLRILYANQSAAHLLGVTVEEAIHRDARWVVTDATGAHIPPEGLPASVCFRTKASVLGTIVGVIRPDDSTVWLIADASPIKTPDGRVKNVVVSFTDITRELRARIRTEPVSHSLGDQIRERDIALQGALEALERTEAQSRAVLRAMAEGVVVHAPDGSIIFANPAAERILGLTLAQLQGQHPIDPRWRLTDHHGEPLDAAKIPSEITRHTGVPQSNFVLGVRRGSDQSEAWLSVNTDPIQTPAASPPEKLFSVVATFTDITTERAALAEARRARDQLADITRSLPGVVLEFTVDHDRRVGFSYVSEQALLQFGAPSEEMMRDPAVFTSRIHPEDTHLSGGKWAEPATRGEPIQAEARVRTNQGEYRHFRLRSGPPVPVPDGWLYRAVAFDITEQKRLETAVREVQRREALGSLAAGIAHNFNNMLAAIVPSVELAQQIGSPAVAATLADASTAARAATELVRQLMQLVRRESAGEPAPVDLRTLVEEVVQLSRRTFGAEVGIQYEPSAIPAVALAPRAELQQVLVNLCINARDALKGRAGALIVLRLRTEEQQIVLEVEDNGTGIPPEAQARLGEPFFTTKPAGEGTGLGLATAYGIVAKLRGQLGFRTELGRGTCFELSLPRHADQTCPPSPHLLRPAPPLRRLRILVVDDEPVVRSVLKRALERIGMTVVLATGGMNGLELFRAGPTPDLVLLDLTMPDCDGIEVLSRIREVNTSIPVYLMTGFLPDGLPVELAQGTLTKPLELDRLYSLVNEVAQPVAPA